MKEHIATYLNDHLAGSVAGLQVIDDLITKLEGSPAGRTLEDLKAEIEADRDVLAALIKDLGSEESSFRKAAGWLSEKAVELKLRLDDTADGTLAVLESLEALSLGIEGKRTLWRAMAAAAKQDPGLGRADYARLRKRAKKQRKTVEALRLDAAREALAGAK